MRMTVSFAEMNAVLPASFDGEQAFAVDLGETQVLYDGQNGATFFPAVSSDGILSWTNDRDLQNPAPVCIKGADGKDGAPGEKGEPGERGLQGIQGEKGEKGDPGKDGINGTNGKDGYTPVRGVDYYTDADKADMVAAVIAALPVYGGEYA